MNINKKSLTKVFGPVLLLTATLALPMDMAQAAPHGRAAAHAKADQHEQKHKGNHKQQRNQGNRVRQRTVVKEKKVVVQRAQRPPQHRRHVVQRQKVVKRQVVVQQQSVRRQQALARQQALQLQAQRQQRVAFQRQQALQRQRQLALQRQQALERQRILQRRQNRGNRYDDRYYAATPRRGGGGADPNVFHVDGYLDDGGDCLFLRDHEGRTWAMVGNTYGLEPGQHVRLYGRPVDGGACGYRAAAFDIYEVRTVWADNNHKRTYYDHLYDGPFDQNRAYDDDRYYNGQYDTYEDRQDRDSWWDRIFGG